MARNDPARLKLLFPNYVPDATLSGGQWAAGDLSLDAGITEEMIVIRNPADTINLHRTTICATLREPTALEQSVYLRMNAGFVWEEAL